MLMQRAILAVSAIAALACGGDDGGQGPGGGGGEDDQVSVRNNSFSPATLGVDAGSTVFWVWASGGTLHNVTFDDDVASGNLGDGTFERTFSEPGTYPYHCTIHGSATAGMRGTVTVAAAAGDVGGGGNSNGGGAPVPGY
jgi:plastocyanin